MYVCPVMGFNVLQIKCADCAAFSPHRGFVSLSVHPYFVRQNTDERAAKVHFFLLIFRIIFLFASLIFDTSMEFRYTCVVFIELCPIPSLIIGMGMSISLAMLAHVCRAVYVVSGIFNSVISPIFFKL